MYEVKWIKDDVKIITFTTVDLLPGILHHLNEEVLMEN